MMKFKNILKSFALLSVLTIETSMTAQTVKRAADNVVRTSTSGTVTGNLNVVKVDNNEYVRLTSGTALGIPVPSSISLEYNQNIPAYTTYYLKINTTDNFL